MSILDEIAELEKAKEKLLLKYEKLKANKTFKCNSCGKLHKVKDCEIVQTYWYTPPRGCTEGDYWNTGEVQIICPETKVRNRMLFSPLEIKNIEKDINARDFSDKIEQNFRLKYKHLFKRVFDLNSKSVDSVGFRIESLPTVNNYYVCHNWKKFDLDI